MTVRLSEEAAEQLDDILNYLEERWSVRTRNNFIDKLERSFDSISTFPTGYPRSEKYPDLRKCVINPQTIAFYRVRANYIEIVSIINASQNK